MPFKIVISEHPSDADLAAIRAPLIGYNLANAAPPKFEPVAIMLQDAINKNSVGGLWGKIAYDWMFVELLFVPDQARGAGLGSKLLAEAETIGRQKGCVGIWLDTHSFQAPGFYLKQGYEAFGALDDYPKGEKRIFLRKML